jgi:hypothetical protein
VGKVGEACSREIEMRSMWRMLSGKSEGKCNGLTGRISEDNVGMYPEVLACKGVKVIHLA